MDLGQQIKVDFEKAFSTKGTPVSDYVCIWYNNYGLLCILSQKGTKAELHDACLVMETLGGHHK